MAHSQLPWYRGQVTVVYISEEFLKKVTKKKREIGKPINIRVITVLIQNLPFTQYNWETFFDQVGYLRSVVRAAVCGQQR